MSEDKIRGHFFLSTSCRSSFFRDQGYLADDDQAEGKYRRYLTGTVDFFREIVNYC